MLNIPIKHVGGHEGRQKYIDVELDNTYDWKKVHWRTLETAYRTSPFFEFYEDDIRPLYKGNETSLYEFNLKTIQAISNCLGLEFSMNKTSSYELQPKDYFNARFLVEAKKELPIKMKPYIQVFGERHGFIPNLSILDLLFNEGTNTVFFLKNQSLEFLDV
jgi:hypothetical protein